MDYEQARFNMVEQQVRTWDVLDQEILDLLFVVKREEFVPPVYRSLAFADLEIAARERPAHVGAEGRGARPAGIDVQAAGVRAGDRHRQRLFRRVAGPPRGMVTSVEIDPRLVVRRGGQAGPQRHRNVRCEVGDGARGWGTRTIRRDRAHRIDAAASRILLRAAETRGPRLRDRRRASGDDGAPRALGGAGRPRHDRSFRNRRRAACRTPRRRRGSGFDSRRSHRPNWPRGARTRRVRRRCWSTCASHGNSSAAASRDRWRCRSRSCRRRAEIAAGSRTGPGVPSRQPQPARGDVARAATATRNLHNLRGGVEAWALDVDPAMPRY